MLSSLVILLVVYPNEIYEDMSYSTQLLTTLIGSMVYGVNGVVELIRA